MVTAREVGGQRQVCNHRHTSLSLTSSASPKNTDLDFFCGLLMDAVGTVASPLHYCVAPTWEMPRQPLAPECLPHIGNHQSSPDISAILSLHFSTAVEADVRILTKTAPSSSKLAYTFQHRSVIKPGQIRLLINSYLTIKNKVDKDTTKCYVTI